MIKWLVFFLLWVLATISFQLVVPKAIDYSTDIYIELEWEDGQASVVYGVPDVLG